LSTLCDYITMRGKNYTRKVYVLHVLILLANDEQNEHRDCIHLIENKVNERMPFVSIPSLQETR
jgi:hypothetical protein